MRPLIKLVDTILGWFLASVLLLMALLTFLDVFMRSVLNRPLAAAFEITEFLLVLAVFSGLCLTSRRGEHITLDLIDNMLPATMLAALKRISDLVVASILGGGAWLMAERAARLNREDSVSVGLHIHHAPFVWFIVGSLGLMALLHVARAVSEEQSRG